MNLSEKNTAILFHILEKNFPDCRILLFGSRATGKAKNYSDIDLAIDCNGSALPLMKLADAKQDFVESDLPYLVDLVDLNNIDNSFKEKILSEAKELNVIVGL
ncbi:MAG: nucleotidyltransferase domain-containing protein [Balneolaceae bacterium]